MALIKTKNESITVDPNHVIASTGVTDFVICKKPEKLKVLLDAIEPGKCVYYISDGGWSMHDMVVELLKKYSPAAVYITTYALREYSVRQLVLAIERKDITEVNMILDYRAPVRTPAVHKMAEMNFNVYLMSVHAKITVIKSEKGSVVIVGSANWTTNPKVESGVVTIDDKVANFYIEHIKLLMDGNKIFG